MLRSIGNAGSPLVTNASHNRNMAELAFKAGLTVEQIVAEWPEVWKLDAAGKIGQKYDYELNDGSLEVATVYGLETVLVAKK